VHGAASFSAPKLVLDYLEVYKCCHVELDCLAIKIYHTKDLASHNFG
jgi:hypothetical protein